MKRHGEISALTLLILAIIGGAGIYLAIIYHGIKNQTHQINTAWPQVQSQYQRRMDLIPNLIKAVNKESGFDPYPVNELIDAVNRATATPPSPDLINDTREFKSFEQAQLAVSSSLASLILTIGKYPALKANHDVIMLINEITATDKRLALAKAAYNKAVLIYNTAINMFPKNIVAYLSGFSVKPAFQPDDALEAD